MFFHDKKKRMNEKTGLSWFFNTHQLITDLKLKNAFFVILL